MKSTSVSERPVAQRGAASEVSVGASVPLGATVTTDGVNFSVFSKSATGVDLLLFDHVENAKPAQEIVLNPVANRTYRPGLFSSSLVTSAASS